jgi:S1-C subfamily serine protease
MTTAHGQAHQDGEQTPDNEQAPTGQAPTEQAPTEQAPAGQARVGQPPYWGQQGAAPHSGYAAYGAVPPPPPPPAMWPGYAAPGDHVGPAHAAGRGDGRSRRRVMAVVGGIAALGLAAGGTAWATSGAGTLTAAEVATQTNPGLVDVISTLGFQHATAEGTGMVLTPTGEVLTNNHVVAGATSIKVRDIGNGHTYTAKVVGYSDSNDVAVLQLTGAAGLSTVTVGDSSTAKVGQDVVALGNAEGKDATPSVATGKITALGASVAAQDQGSGTVEHLTGMIRTNADIQPGDSGGPLLNSSGEVIGMDTAASTGSSSGVGTTASVSTTAFSIPINKAMSIADQIEAGKSSVTVHIGATAFLGVEVASANAGGFGQASSGVPVAGAVQGTAAAAAGLGNGDTILSVGGHQIASGSDLQQVIETHHPGDKVTVTWSDQLGQSHSATVTLTAGPTG